MSKYFTQFDEPAQTIGTNLAGWTVRTGGAPGRVPAYGTPPVKRRYLSYTNDSTATSRVLSWDAIDGDANRDKINLATLIHMPHTTAAIVTLYVRLTLSGATITDAYRLRLDLGAGVVYLDKWVASAFTANVSNFAHTFTGTKGWFVRFDAQGTTIRAKVWDADLGAAGEPAAWGLSVTDSGVSAAGYCAIDGYSSVATGRVTAFNFVAVGTNGDSAVCPRTNAEFLAWLETPARRCVLFDMQATGYDSSGSPYTKTVNAYVSNMGYTSHPQDTPASQHYDAYVAQIPTFTRQMPAELAGPVSVGFGDLVLRNGAGPSLRYCNLILRSEEFDNAAWSGAATVTANSTVASDGTTTADTITDSSAVAIQGRTQALTVPNDTGKYVVSFELLKTSGGTSPTCGWDIPFTGGSTTSRTPRFNTDTGAFIFDGANTSVRSTRDGNYWLVEIEHSNNGSGNTTFTINFYPAISPYNTVGDTATQTGAAVVARAWVRRGSLNDGVSYVKTTSDAADYTLQPGLLDDWLRVSWNRSTLRGWLGDPSWPRHDFRAFLVGRLGQPTAPSMDLLKFPIADLSGLLEREFQTNTFSGTGPYQNFRKPYVHGAPLYMEAVATGTGLEMQVHDGAIYGMVDVFDDGVSLTGSATVSSVDAGTDTITTTANHGLAVDARVVFLDSPAPAPPAGLSVSTTYYVKTVPGLNQLTLSATRGGATVNITGTGTGGIMTTYLWWEDTASGKLTLVSNPAGRIMAKQVTRNGPASDENKAARVIADAMFTKYGLSLNYKDATSFSDYETAFPVYLGAVQYFERVRCLDVINMLTVRSNSWWTQSLDGLLQVGRVSLPGTSKKSLTTSDVSERSLRLTATLMPVSRTSLQVYYDKNWMHAGPLNLQPFKEVSLVREHAVELGSSYPAAGIPLDDRPNRVENVDLPPFDTVICSTGEAARIEALRLKKLGIFEFRTKLAALWHSNGPLSIGDTISLEHPRLGWKQFTAADPASPDNTATIDSRLAVVCGIDVNLGSKDPFPVTLKVYRQIPGYYATANLN